MTIHWDATDPDVVRVDGVAYLLREVDTKLAVRFLREVK